MWSRPSNASIIEFSKCVQRHQVTKLLGSPGQFLAFRNGVAAPTRPDCISTTVPMLVEHADLDGRFGKPGSVMALSPSGESVLQRFAVATTLPAMCNDGRHCCGWRCHGFPDIERVNHLIAELDAVKELVRLTERAEPADMKLSAINGPGDTSIEMSAEGAESTHYRGFSATPAFLARLRQLALEELAARQQAIIDDLAKLGVEA